MRLYEMILDVIGLMMLFTALAICVVVCPLFDFIDRLVDDWPYKRRL